MQTGLGVEQLWKIVQEGRKDGGSTLLRNGLTAQENWKLMTTTDTLDAVHLVWEGLSRLFLESAAPNQVARNT